MIVSLLLFGTGVLVGVLATVFVLAWSYAFDAE